MGKLWNVDIFEIVAPPRTLAKTVPKLYLTDTLGLFQSYISHNVQNFAFILPLVHPYLLLS